MNCTLSESNVSKTTLAKGQHIALSPKKSLRKLNAKTRKAKFNVIGRVLFKWLNYARWQYVPTYEELNMENFGGSNG